MAEKGEPMRLIAFLLSLLCGPAFAQFVDLTKNAIAGTSSVGQLLQSNGSTVNPLWTNNLYWDATNSRLGLGTATPTYAFDINKSTNTFHVARVYATNTGSSTTARFVLGNDGSSAGGQLILNSSGNTSFAGASSLNLYQGLNAPLGIFTNATERIRVTAGGNVGINTTSPGSLFEIKNGSMRFTASDGTYVGFHAASGTTSKDYRLPTVDGANTNVLMTDGAGNLSWTTAGGGGGTGLQSINGSTTAAQTIVPGTGLTVTDSGVGSYVHTVAFDSSIFSVNATSFSITTGSSYAGGATVLSAKNISNGASSGATFSAQAENGNLQFEALSSGHGAPYTNAGVISSGMIGDFFVGASANVSMHLFTNNTDRIVISGAGLTTFGTGTQVDSTSYALAIGERSAFNMTAAGGAGGGSANQFGAVLNNVVSSTGSAANYEKAALLAWIQTNDPSTGGIERDAVGIDMRGTIGAANTTGRAWGGIAHAAILAGGDGKLQGFEIEVENGGAAQPTMFTTTSKYGLSLFINPNGSGASATSAITVGNGSNTANKLWYNGLYITDIEPSGYAIQALNGATPYFQVAQTGLTTITTTSEQLRLAHDGSNYASFTVGSTGVLNISPTGSARYFVNNHDSNYSSQCQ